MKYNSVFYGAKSLQKIVTSQNQERRGEGARGSPCAMMLEIGRQ